MRWGHLTPYLGRASARPHLQMVLCINISSFVAGEVDIPIKTMPGRYMLGWRHGLIEEVSIVSFQKLRLGN